MSARFTFELANLNDDDALKACLAANHMGEGISVSFRREPSYFDACDIQGQQAQVIKCTDQKKSRIIGLGSRFTVPAFVNGKAQKAGYLADLRCEPEARKGTLLARGYHYLNQLHQQQPLQSYFTMILSNNQTALKQLTSQRAGLPDYQHLGKIHSPAIFLDLPKSAIKIPGLSFREANHDNLAEVFKFIRSQNQHKQFAPIYDHTDVGTKRLKNLAANDIYVAYQGDQIVATLAAWDQSDFRQTYIEGYATYMKIFKPFYNSLAAISPLKPLPKAGHKIPFLYFSMISCVDNNPRIFSALLRHVYLTKRTGNWHYAVIGLHEQDPLAECLKSYRKIDASGELFAVHYPDTGVEIEKPSQRIPYIELACL